MKKNKKREMLAGFLGYPSFLGERKEKQGRKEEKQIGTKEERREKEWNRTKQQVKES